MPGRSSGGRFPAADQGSIGLASCAPQGCDPRGGQQGPAIFWPCKESPPPQALLSGSYSKDSNWASRVATSSPAVAPRELQVIREELRDSNSWLKDELQMHFAEIDRKLDLLDLTNCLQERLLAHFADTNKKLDIIASQISRCEASLEKAHQPHKVGLVSIKTKTEALVSESSAGMSSIALGAENRRGSLNSVETLNQYAAGLFRAGNPYAEKISQFLFDPESSKPAYWFAMLWPEFVMVTAVLTLLQTMDQDFWSGFRAMACEVVIDLLFWIEVVVRYFGCPTSWGFFKSPYNLIDIAAALPLALRGAVGFFPPEDGFARFVLLCWAPLLRLLKMLRWLKQFHLFARVLDDTKEALKFLLFLLFLIVLMFASLFYLAEPRDVIASLPQAMWFTIVTVTTVGYNQPVTEAGHVVLTCLLISSVLYMAMPIGILGNAFTEIWKDRDLILLASRTEDRLAQWGYTPSDLPQIFRIFDNESKGELSVSEFRTMLDSMRVGLTDKRIVEVFNLLDSDDGGSIDYKEFLKRLFPDVYYELYGSKRKGRSGREAARRSPSASPTGTTLGTRTMRGVPSSASRTPVEDSSPRSDADGHPAVRAAFVAVMSERSQRAEAA